MFNLIINNTHVANSLNNMYQYNFKNGSFEVPADAEMMITSLQIPYTWYNVTRRQRGYLPPQEMALRQESTRPLLSVGHQR